MRQSEEPYHEVTLDVGQLVGQLLFVGVVYRAINLVVVVVQAGDVCTSKLRDLAGGSTDTAADVQHILALLDADLVCQVVLVAGNGLVEGLAHGEAAEVEGLAPSELVDIGCEVVVAIVRIAWLTVVRAGYLEALACGVRLVAWGGLTVLS